MFDIAFSELLLIGVVALVVIGPERLPKVARTAGAWLGRLNRYVAQVKQDIDRDIQLDELRKLQQQMKDTAQKYEVIAAETGQELKREVDQVERVMQAMAVTDGGLAMQEYQKIKDEQNAAALDGIESVPAATEPEREPAKVEHKAEANVTATEAPESFRSHLDDEISADEPQADNSAQPQQTPTTQNT